MLLLTACGSRRKMVSVETRRETADTIAVQTRSVEQLETGERTWERIREVIVLEADSTGAMKETQHTITRETEREQTTEKTAENVQKVDSTAFSSESNIIYQSIEKKSVERKETAFGVVLIFLFAAIVGLFVSLRKIWKR